MPQQRRAVDRGLRQLGRLGQQGAGPAGVSEVVRRLDHRGDAGPGRGERCGDGEQQRAAARHDHPPARQGQSGLQHRLRATGAHHTRQGPAGEGQLTLVCAGRQQYRAGPYPARAVLVAVRTGEGMYVPRSRRVRCRYDRPDVVSCEMGHLGGGQAAEQGGEGGPVVVEGLGARGAEGGGGVSVVLAAGLP